VFVLAALALFTRRTGLFLHPQFYAEDGYVWFAQAYNTGWLHSLTLPEGGYLNTLQRLVAGLSLLVPFRWSPAVMVWAGLLIQVLPLSILLSARCRDWASLRARLVFAAIYIALPNAKEIHVVLTNAQWHWALAEVLLAFAAPPRTWKGRSFDALIFLIGGFTGPFSILLIPLVLAFGWMRRQKWSFAVAGMMGIGTIIQAVLLVHGARSKGVLGGSFPIILRFFGGDVIEFTIFGSQNFILHAPAVLNLGFVLFGLLIHLYCLRFANLETRLFVVYCELLFIASLRSPMPSEKGPLLFLLLGNIGARYWFFPMLAFTWCVVWWAFSGGSGIVRTTGYCILCLMPIAAIRGWIYEPFPDEHFSLYAQQLQQARVGQRVVIPIIPTPKQMELVKRAE